MFENLNGTSLDRRSFLRGSTVFAAAIGLAVTPALAEPQKPQPPKKETPADPFAKNGDKKSGKLYDQEGREYRICPQCGFNMYKEGRMWVCENCGYSYVE